MITESKIYIVTSFECKECKVKIKVCDRCHRIFYRHSELYCVDDGYEHLCDCCKDKEEIEEKSYAGN